MANLHQVPDDYDELLSYYTHKGYRVIACATKHMKKLSWVKTQKMKREDAEKELEFVGFIIFENKLKPTTAAVLKELTQSNIGSVMVTGDNILTAISVSRNCGLVDKNAHCFVPHFAEGSFLLPPSGHASTNRNAGNFQDPNADLHWESIDDPKLRLDSRTLLVSPHEARLPQRVSYANETQPCLIPSEQDASLPYDITNLKDYSLAVSGDAFRWIVDFAPADVLQRVGCSSVPVVHPVH